MSRLLIDGSKTEDGRIVIDGSGTDGGSNVTDCSETDDGRMVKDDDRPVSVTGDNKVALSIIDTTAEKLVTG
jgi:hypothetical protein